MEVSIATASQPQVRNSNAGGRAHRPRVSKACDRCRLKKAKCDGACPCTRCDDGGMLCMFSDRRSKPTRKTCTSEYVELLERQQECLLSGIRELHRRLSSYPNSLPSFPTSSANDNSVWRILEEIGSLDACRTVDHVDPAKAQSKSSSLDCDHHSPTPPGSSYSMGIVVKQSAKSEQLPLDDSDVNPATARTPASSAGWQMFSTPDIFIPPEPLLSLETACDELDEWPDMTWTDMTWTFPTGSDLASFTPSAAS